MTVFVLKLIQLLTIQTFFSLEVVKKCHVHCGITRKFKKVRVTTEFWRVPHFSEVDLSFCFDWCDIHIDIMTLHGVPANTNEYFVESCAWKVANIKGKKMRKN